MKRITTAIMLLTLSIALGGCASLTDSVVSVEMCIRNQVLAQKAWGHWSWCYDKLDNSFDFACGFKAGYRDILEGGNGCQPTLPPKCYWKPQHQTPEGRCKVHAWFDGFSHGALAAKQDGYGDMGQIPISPTAQANLDRARRPVEQNDIYSNYSSNGAAQVPVGDRIQLAPPSVLGMEDVAPDAHLAIPVPLRPYE